MVAIQPSTVLVVDDEDGLPTGGAAPGPRKSIPGDDRERRRGGAEYPRRDTRRRRDARLAHARDGRLRDAAAHSSTSIRKSRWSSSARCLLTKSTRSARGCAPSTSYASPSPRPKSSPPRSVPQPVDLPGAASPSPTRRCRNAGAHGRRGLPRRPRAAPRRDRPARAAPSDGRRHVLVLAVIEVRQDHARQRRADRLLDGAELALPPRAPRRSCTSPTAPARAVRPPRWM